MTPSTRRLLVSTLLLLSCIARGHADSAGGGPDARPQRIRTTDRSVQALIDAGVQTSPTFRALVNRIEKSDVVVDVKPDLHCVARMWKPPPEADDAHPGVRGCTARGLRS